MKAKKAVAKGRSVSKGELRRDRGDHRREEVRLHEGREGPRRDHPRPSEEDRQGEPPGHRARRNPPQEGDEGREEDDVRPGGEGQGEARAEGREGLSREGTEGPVLRRSSQAPEMSWPPGHGPFERRAAGRG